MMSNNQPLVSILIPVYNRVNIIEETIFSALNQSYKNIEIIISDNNSTDGTIAVLKKIQQNDLRVKVLFNEKNEGPVKNWQKCVEQASGVYGLFLWSDDLLEKGVVERSIGRFNDEIGFVISQYTIFDSDGTKKTSTFQRQNIITSKELLDDLLIYQVTDFPFSPAGTVFRMKDIRSNLLVEIDNPLGLTYSKYGAGNDLLIFLATLSNYKYIYCIDETGVYFRNHTGSITMTTNLFKYYEYSRLYFVINYKDNYLPLMKTKYALKSIFRENYKIFSELIPGKVKLKFLIFLINLIYRKLIKI